MNKRYIVTALVFVMLAPLNVVASAWMTQSSSVIAADETAMAQEHMMGHDHEAMTSSGQKQAMMDAHEHDAEDCDDYCMNCSSHCSSTAIPTSANDIIELDQKFNKILSGETSSRSYLLFRPPIRS